MPERRLIIFIKAPRSDSVKTRLAAVLGAEAARAAYRQMVDVLIERLRRLSDVELRYTPDDAADEVRAWSQPDWILKPQGDGDLGRRLSRAFSEAFDEACRRVVAIGSDCPDVTMADMEAAWASLESNDLVIGPAEDGGYWLIGLRDHQPALWQGITWSSDQVLAQTLQRAHDRRLRCEMLRMLSDIDTLEQWERWRRGRGQ